jgi:hypothetical protein
MRRIAREPAISSPDAANLGVRFGQLPSLGRWLGIVAGLTGLRSCAGFQKPEQEGHEEHEGHAEGIEGSGHTTERQQPMIEKAPGFEIGALISASGSLSDHLQLQFFMSFMLFMSFLFRI